MPFVRWLGLVRRRLLRGLVLAALAFLVAAAVAGAVLLHQHAGLVEFEHRRLLDRPPVRELAEVVIPGLVVAELLAALRMADRFGDIGQPPLRTISEMEASGYSRSRSNLRTISTVVSAPINNLATPAIQSWNSR